MGISMLLCPEQNHNSPNKIFFRVIVFPSLIVIVCDFPSVAGVANDVFQFPLSSAMIFIVFLLHDILIFTVLLS